MAVKWWIHFFESHNCPLWTGVSLDELKLFNYFNPIPVSWAVSRKLTGSVGGSLRCLRSTGRSKRNIRVFSYTGSRAVLACFGFDATEQLSQEWTGLCLWRCVQIWYNVPGSVTMYQDKTQILHERQNFLKFCSVLIVLHIFVERISFSEKQLLDTTNKPSDEAVLGFISPSLTLFINVVFEWVGGGKNPHSSVEVQINRIRSTDSTSLLKKKYSS